MALSCLTWNNGKPCVWFDLKLNCCADPVDYVSSEGGLQVCRYHQYAVEVKTSEQGESPATTGNSDYAAALRVFNQYHDSIDSCDMSFLNFCEQRLNPAKAPDESGWTNCTNCCGTGKIKC